MKAQSVLTLGSVMLLATIVQADHFVIMNAASSRTSSYLFNDVGNFIAAVKPMGTGGEQSLDKVIKDNVEDNTLYLKQFLNPFAKHLGTNPTKVFLYGTGATQNLDTEREQAVWNNIKKVFDVVNAFDRKFVLQESKTLPAKEEITFGFDIAKELSAPNTKTMSVAFHGSSFDVANGLEFKTFRGAGIVSASEIHVKNLWPSESERNDYETKTKAMVDASKKQYDECRKDKEQMVCAEEQKQRDIAALKKAVSAEGEMKKYLQWIDNPCLLKEDNPMVTINAYIVKKSLEATLRELVPFKGTGNFDKCRENAARQINNHVMPSVHETPFSVVALGGTRHWEKNLKKAGIETNAVEVKDKNGEKMGTMWTVEQIGTAAKEACGKTFTQYAEDVVNKETISGHLLAESCWAPTYIYAVLKKLKLKEAQTILLTDKHWEHWKAKEIVQEYYARNI